MPDAARDRVDRHSPGTIALHWLGALLVFAGFALGLFMTGLPLSPAKLQYYGWHKWLGITVFLVAAARLALRVAYPSPPWPATMPAWQAGAARWSHRALYALMLAIPLSGWLYSSAAGVSVVYLGIMPLPNLVAKDRELAAVLLLAHQSLNFALALAVTGHVGAALWHRCVDRDGILARMLPGRRP